jgi:hypothetical protein
MIRESRGCDSNVADAEPIISHYHRYPNPNLNKKLFLFGKVSRAAAFSAMLSESKWLRMSLEVRQSIPLRQRACFGSSVITATV